MNNQKIQALKEEYEKEIREVEDRLTRYAGETTKILCENRMAIYQRVVKDLEELLK